MRYFDFAATTPLCAEAREAMLPWLQEDFYNASSLYAGGKRARAAVENARAQVAALLSAFEDEIVFTSGGTEADNTALFSAAQWGREHGRNRLIVSSIEHHAILESAEYLKKMGTVVTILPVDEKGFVRLADLEAALDEDVALVSVMWVNNELGTVQDVKHLAELTHIVGALFHTDAVQALSGQNVDFHAVGADLMSVSSHKIYGPKGCGALAIRRGLELDSFMHGGQQENGRRGGTENVAGLVGFGRAAELMAGRRAGNVADMSANRAAMLELLKAAGARINSPEDGSPTILNVAFRDVEAEGMMFFLSRNDWCVSMGSACNSKSVEPSHVVRAIGVPEEYARGCVRISFGCGQSRQDCLDLAAELISLAGQLKN